LQVGGREVESPAIDIRSLLAQPICGGAHDTSIHDEAEQVGGLRSAGHFRLHMFEDGELVAVEGLFGPVGESDSITVLRSCGSVRDDADAAVRFGQDLGSRGNYEVKLIHVLHDDSAIRLGV
jgi:hypothetical protein